MAAKMARHIHTLANKVEIRKFFGSHGFAIKLAGVYATEHDLVVLAVGMEPEVTGVKLPDDLVLDSSNFIEGSKSGGMFGAGSAASPLDVNRAVQSATAASLKAIQVIHKTASTEVSAS